MKLQWFTFSFEQFSTYQLYEVLALRSQVFVVEQNCIYQDIDGADQKALHVCAYDMQDSGPVLVAYARIFNAGIKFAEAAIEGRAVNIMVFTVRGAVAGLCAVCQAESGE